MGITIRTAMIDDHEGVARIASELNVMHARALPDRFRITSDALPDEYFHSLIESQEATILVAERDGEVLGYAILLIKNALPISVAVPRHVAFLNDIAVTKVEQGRGIGRLLTDAAVAWAREQGASALELGVFEFNADAIAFYEHLGFQSTKRTMSLPIEHLVPKGGETQWT